MEGKTRSPELVKSMQEYCAKLQVAGLQLYTHLESLEVNARVMDVDTSTDGDGTSASSSPSVNLPSTPGSSEVAMEVEQDPEIQIVNPRMSLSPIFDSPVEMEDSVPPSHSFVKQAFEAEQFQVFLKIIRNEMTNFRQSFAPGIKVRAYGDRLVIELIKHEMKP